MEKVKGFKLTEKSKNFEVWSEEGFFSRDHMIVMDVINLLEKMKERGYRLINSSPHLGDSLLFEKEEKE